VKPDSTAITVLLVDDHAVVREGYRRLLERNADIRVVGEAGNAAQAYQLFCEFAPQIVVMDISLPDVSGIEAMRRMLAREPRARVLVFSMHEEPIFPERAMRAGALGYITKASAPEVLVNAVRAVACGKMFLSADIAQSMALRNVQAQEPELGVLSNREFEILRMLASGETVNTIAARLGLSYKTVANYQSAIRQKLGAQTPAQLLRIATRYGVVPDTG
jgi:DNA-binding NarL/FixJ family response regulator